MLHLYVIAFGRMADQPETLSLISSWVRCPLWIGFEPAQNLSSGFGEWGCEVVITLPSTNFQRFLEA